MWLFLLVGLLFQSWPNIKPAVIGAVDDFVFMMVVKLGINQ
jgi:hypothetical protein